MAEMTVSNVKAVLGEGGVIAYPTEAVWGLGCDPWQREAVERILAIKHRPMEKGLILVAASQEQLSPLLEPLSSEHRQLLSATWPGPVTWLIPDPNDWIPVWVKGQFDTVAVRVSNHPLVRELCEAAGHPLVSTSANRAGEDPLLSIQDVKEQFDEQLDLVVPGETGSQSSPSEIRDLQTGKIIRTG